MPKWYRKVVIPRLLGAAMASKGLEDIRRDVIANVSGTVLEIGVGHGYNLPFYSSIAKLYALEPSSELIASAKTRAQDLSFPVEFLNTSAERIPLPDNCVDVVVSTWTLCSVADAKKVLQEIKRVLRPHGKFIFVDHGASPHKFICLAQKVFTIITKRFAGNCHSDREIEALIRQAGFSIQSMKHPGKRLKPLVYNYQGIALKL